MSGTVEYSIDSNKPTGCRNADDDTLDAATTALDAGNTTGVTNLVKSLAQKQALITANSTPEEKRDKRSVRTKMFGIVKGVPSCTFVVVQGVIS